MGLFLVLKAEVVRSLITMRRYWLASLIGLIIGYGMLIALIWAFTTGGQSAVGEKIKEGVTSRVVGSASLEAPPESSGTDGEPVAVPKPSESPKERGTKIMNGVLGLLIGLFAFSIIGMFSQGLAGMAQSGELEQLCMSPHGLLGNFLARSFVSALTNILSSSILVALVSITIPGGALHFSAGAIPALLALTYVNLLGFGFMVGGLVLVFKQTGQVAMLIQIAMLSMSIAASKSMSEWPLLIRIVAHIMPMTDATVCLKLVLLDGVGMQVFSYPSFFFLLINCAVWTSIGIACFKFMENWSRNKGTLGTY
ncbi:MAG TPA: hypothetical protein PLO62_05050 [Candidatus Hydrogenedentes bacterium]|nr:hypothetical protein [Candidatus Hydrogenedentota bacterium]